MRAGITVGYGVGAHNAFYRAGEEGSGREVGSQEAPTASAISLAQALCFRREIERRGNGEPGREWKGGGGQATSGPVRRRWPEVHDSAWHGGAGQRRRRLRRDRGRRKASCGPAWAGLGRASWAAVGPVREFPKKRSWAAMVSWAENQKSCRKNPFQFFKQRFDFKSQGFKYF
jgi:hypothetical protein